jgi:plastocyanin
MINQFQRVRGEMMKKLSLLVMSVMVLSLALTACGGSKPVTIDVDMKEYEFIPSTIEVPAGAEVTVNLSNLGTVEHEMVIMVLGKEATVPFDDDDEPNIFWEHELEMGESESVVFTAPSEPGEYQIVCGIPSHIELGMVGTLIVK